MFFQWLWLLKLQLWPHLHLLPLLHLPHLLHPLHPQHPRNVLIPTLVVTCDQVTIRHIPEHIPDLTLEQTEVVNNPIAT